MADNKEAPENKSYSYVQSRQNAYRRVFAMDNQDVQLVLADLAAFCRATKSTFHPDARAHALQEGRREVWLRLTRNLELDTKTLFELSTRGEIKA